MVGPVQKLLNIFKNIPAHDYYKKVSVVQQSLSHIIKNSAAPGDDDPFNELEGIP